MIKKIEKTEKKAVLTLMICFLVEMLGLTKSLEAQIQFQPLEQATLYEVNVRQFTPDGTFASFEEHLPRLKELGVSILWMMPIHPISKEKRKGTLGSYYAVSDYRDINPEYGTMSDFKDLVRNAHALGIRVIIDWVANHTGWDHAWIKQFPDYYTKDKNGNITDPIDPQTGESWGWTDVADLNYENMDMQKAMIEEMAYWVTEADIDGFRCDVAHNVPITFWEKARKEIDKIKPCFWLAEAEQPELTQHAFDMVYAWELLHINNAIAKGEKKVKDLFKYFKQVKQKYQADDYLMNFITNHDENTWAGTEFERYGEGAKAFAVMSFTVPGMPLIYSGQEVGLNKRLRFFEKDTILWNDDSGFTSFYKKLCQLKSGNKALAAGEHGGDMQLHSVANANVFALSRKKGDDNIFVVLNLSKDNVKMRLPKSVEMGEVVQRPASVVKELIENSLDAGATRISIVIKDAGKTLIQIVDNGSGMIHEDALSSFERFATSKIKHVEDLEVLHTFGFRGEALASISAVAHVELRTRSAEESIGTLVEINDVFQQNAPKISRIQYEQGTSISVRNLFFNVPARRKFLKTDQTEFKRIYEIVKAFSLLHRDIQWVFIVDERELLNFDGINEDNFINRIEFFLGKNMAASVVPISETNDFLTVSGFLGKPAMSKRTKNDQLLFVNSRLIESNSLSFAIVQGYGDLLGDREYPFFMLNFKLNPKKIDVNVHPSKMEVKFEDERNIFNMVKAIISRFVRGMDFAPSVVLEKKLERGVSANNVPDYGMNCIIVFLLTPKTGIMMINDYVFMIGEKGLLERLKNYLGSSGILRKMKLKDWICHLMLV
ncbi:hypothetical protein CHS0354_000443 [Potamilus streckersoni]|uniref:Alpha-amylase n=1 Tax=Potamilus streckersoni TaxID=2493646 RepID=A0AAE0W939_9BIVA|nr:hypothetical protein CHS0354_000443 [Potamilus streckersoni]